MNFWFWLLVGLFVGACVGLLVLALCVAAGDADRLSESEQWRWIGKDDE